MHKAVNPLRGEVSRDLAMLGVSRIDQWTADHLMAT
jgi:hypothetical protein